MAQFDWIKSNEFEGALRERFTQQFEAAKIQGMPFTFGAELAKLARENQATLESRAATVPDRTMNDALASVDTIAAAAIAHAREAKREYVTQEDLTAAIQLTFCRIWPFCR